MTDYLIHDSTLEDISDAIRSKTGGSSLIAPEDMPSEIESISGGGSVTNGVVFNTVDTQGYATEATFYGDILPTGFFGRQNTGANTWAFPNLKKVNLDSSVTKISQNAFRFSNVEEVSAPNVTNVAFPSGNGQAFNYATALKKAILPMLTSVSINTFANCTALQSVEIGSVGYGVNNIATTSFANCSQTGLTITVYTTGSYADAAVANTRNGADNATIVIKASEETTYNGTSYNAGDTILTSEVTS